MHRLSIKQISREPVVILNHHVRARVRNPTLLSWFQRIGKYIIDLCDGVVWHLAQLRRHIVADVSGPSYIDLPSSGIERPVGRPATFAASRMILRSQRTGCELPHAIGDLYGPAVVQISRHNHHGFAKRVPEPDHLL